MSAGLLTCKMPHALDLSDCLSLIRCWLNIFSKNSAQIVWCLSQFITSGGTQCHCGSWLILISCLWYVHETDTLHLCGYSVSQWPLSYAFSIRGSASPRSVFCQGLENGDFPIQSLLHWLAFLSKNEPSPFRITMDAFLYFLIINHYCCYCYWCPNCPSFGQESPFKLTYSLITFQTVLALFFSNRFVLDFQSPGISF